MTLYRLNFALVCASAPRGNIATLAAAAVVSRKRLRVMLVGCMWISGNDQTTNWGHGGQGIFSLENPAGGKVFFKKPERRSECAPHLAEARGTRAVTSLARIHPPYGLVWWSERIVVCLSADARSARDRFSRRL